LVYKRLSASLQKRAETLNIDYLTIKKKIRLEEEANLRRKKIEQIQREAEKKVRWEEEDEIRKRTEISVRRELEIRAREEIEEKIRKENEEQAYHEDVKDDQRAVTEIDAVQKTKSEPNAITTEQQQVNEKVSQDGKHGLMYDDVTTILSISLFLISVFSISILIGIKSSSFVSFLISLVFMIIYFIPVSYVSFLPPLLGPIIYTWYSRTIVASYIEFLIGVLYYFGLPTSNIMNNIEGINSVMVWVSIIHVWLIFIIGIVHIYLEQKWLDRLLKVG